MDGMMPEELKFFAEKMTQMEKEIENECENEGKTEENNDNSNNNSNDKKKDNNGNNKKDDDVFNMDECMKLFEQLMGQNTKTDEENNGSDNDKNSNDNKNDKNSNNSNTEANSNGNLEGFLPDLNQMPKLTPEEMQQFSNLLGENGNDCQLM